MLVGTRKIENFPFAFYITKKPPWKGRPVFDPGPLITKFE
jgi:hypothetical protein